MANSAAKERVKRNAALMSKYLKIILGCNAAYVAFRVAYLYSSFSRWHQAGFGVQLLSYGSLYGFLRMSARPKYGADGALLFGGEDMDSKGVLEYVWDLLYVTMFIQLGTGFVSDWFWVTAIFPPIIGFYFLWIWYIYPWISKPDAEPEQMMNRRQQREADRDARRRR